MKARKEDIDDLQSQIFDLATCCKLLKEKTQLMQKEIEVLQLIVKTTDIDLFGDEQ